jgi:hypothetical protein
VQYIREVCAQIAQIETARYDTLMRLKEKASLYVEAKLTGRTP